MMGRLSGYSVDLFPLRVDTSNAGADFTFCHKPGLHGAFCSYRMQQTVSISALSAEVGGQVDWREQREIQPTKFGWRDWSATEADPGVMRLRVASTSDFIEAEPQIGLSLNLRQTRPPILHGDNGLSQKGPELGNATYYYSLVGLETTGEITINGNTVAVTGISWMDHEFGTSFLGEGIRGLGLVQLTVGR